MFDVGLLEVFVVAVIALLVLGPERLPKAVQTTGRWIGRAKRAASYWSDEINRQIDNEELVKEFKESQTLKEFNKQLEPINNVFSKSLSVKMLGSETDSKTESVPDTTNDSQSAEKQVSA
jgi:sec-independent protein translocase protein TatB